jgi:hypothetical protein
MNIYQKLLEVKKHVDFLKKDTKGHQFLYNPSSQVIASVRDKMNEVGLFLECRIESPVLHSKNENEKQYLTELFMKMIWVNVDKPDERIEIPWYGQGLDTGEKGVGKALTYAEKFFILKQFNIPTDKDDPDAHQTPKNNKGNEATANAKSNEPTEELANSKQVGLIKVLVKSIGMVKKVPDLEVLQKALGKEDEVTYDILTTLSKTQASELIKKLQKWQEQSKETVTQ